MIRNALFSGDSTGAGLPATPGGAVLEHRRLVDVVKRELGNIHQPALIVHPREDDYADLDNAWYLQRHLKGVVDMVVLNDSYHIVTVDRQRHVVVDRANDVRGDGHQAGEGTGRQGRAQEGHGGRAADHHRQSGSA